MNCFGLLCFFCFIFSSPSTVSFDSHVFRELSSIKDAVDL